MQLLTKKQAGWEKFNNFLNCATVLVASYFICAPLLWHGSPGSAAPPELWLSSSWGSRFHTFQTFVDGGECEHKVLHIIWAVSRGNISLSIDKMLPI